MSYVVQHLPDAEIEWCSGPPDHPLVTLADEHGGRAQITIDDGCFVLLLEQPNGLYKPTCWWFQEAVDAVKWLHGLRPTPR